jgi:transposase-like protein
LPRFRGHRNVCVQGVRDGQDEATLYKLALRDLPKMFLIRGIVFSHEAVRDWETKLTAALAENLRRRGKVGRSWYVDETYRSTSTGVISIVPSIAPARWST